ncbi:MAG TPA: ATP-binding protein [Bryobacteraceae bacterium]|nr:ATP-binding protein [Bryobacteraceae bacterium]
MAEPACLSDAFVEQSTHCSWVFREGGEFERVSGDPLPVFQKSAAELVGRTIAEALEGELATEWKSRLERALGGETLLLRLRHGEADWAVVIFPVRFEGRLYVGGSALEVTALNAAERELRHTVLGALKAQEFERRMFAKFLHDKVGQNLTALGLQLDLVRMDMQPVSPETAHRVEEIQHLLEGMMEEVREYSYELNPSAVERAGLRSALDRLAGRVRTRFNGSLRVNVDPSLKLDPGVASAMFQIAQEAVENSVQHSSCSAIEIAVKSTRTGPAMEIRDNGRGFDPADIAGGRRGLGLLSMEHHAAQAGLDLSVKSGRGNGVTVRASAPEA